MKKEFIGNENKEFAVLVCLVRDPLLMVSSKLDASDFKNLYARQIFMIMQEIKDRFDKSDCPVPDLSGTNLRSMAQACNIKYDTTILESILGKVEDVVDIPSDHFTGYVAAIKNASIVDKVISAAEGIRETAKNFNVENDAITLLRDAENRILDIENKITDFGEPVSLFAPDALNAQVEEYKLRAEQGVPPGYRTGFDSIDHELMGMVPKTLTVVGARAKTGKSAFALNIAMNVAREYRSDCPILYIDTEMSGEEQRSRALSILSGIDERKIKRHEFVNDEYNRFLDAKAQLTELDKVLYHHYVPNFTAESVLSTVRRFRNLHNIQFLIMDYIKLPDGSDLKAAAEWQFLGYFTSMLKNKIAGALNIPVLTFAQLNRSGVEQALAGEVDETTIGGSDRIVQYCTNYLCLRKSNVEEMKTRPEANLKLHFVVTRHGGECKRPFDIGYSTNMGVPKMEQLIKFDRDGELENEIKLNQAVVDAGKSDGKGNPDNAGSGKGKRSRKQS